GCAPSRRRRPPGWTRPAPPAHRGRRHGPARPVPPPLGPWVPPRVRWTRSRSPHPHWTPQEAGALNNRRPHRHDGRRAPRPSPAWERAAQTLTFCRRETWPRRSLEGLKIGTARAGTSTRSPVRGLRATRDFRLRTLNVPKPRISMFWCSARASLIAFSRPSTTREQSFLVIPGPIALATCSTRSALVIVPPSLIQE